MDFAWPMSEQHEERHEEAQPEAKGSAIDFVMNAWSLLRGEQEGAAGENKKPVEGDEKSSNIAQVSLAAAGGSSDDKDVDFIKQSWALYQQAMEEGWVTEWIEGFMTNDIVINDTVGRPQPINCKGQSEVAKYYNAVLDSIWDNGRVSLTWKPRKFSSMGCGIVLAEYDIEVHPRNVSHTRQLWVYRVVGQKIAEIRMFATVPPEEVDRPPVDQTDIVDAASMCAPQECVDTPMPRAAGMHDCPPYQCHQYPYPYPHIPAHDTPGNQSLIPDNVSIADSMPSLASSVPSISVGVSLTRPCHHNSWDNVRIKRGWAILRCRICQSQWRLRPTAIPHCLEFARGAGCCSRGTDCSQLHVHRTREQSSEAKKAAATARQHQVAIKTTTLQKAQSTLNLNLNVLKTHQQQQQMGFPPKKDGLHGGINGPNGPPQSSLGAHTPYQSQHQPYAMY